jgi:hypothetical protein
LSGYVNGYAVAFLVCLIVGAPAVLFAACSRREPPAPVRREAGPDPAPPPCVREVCAQRPGWLVCESGLTYYCARYRVAYEHHCDCAEWGPPPGGAPKAEAGRSPTPDED